MPAPSRLISGLPALFALVAAVLWRFAPAPTGFAALAATVLTSLLVAWRRQPDAWRGWWLAALAAAVIAALRFVPGWWPCELDCAGAGHYQRIAGVPVLAPAIAAYAVFAALCWIERGRDAPPPLLRHFAWALFGCSFYFLALSVWLRLACPHCLAVQGAVLALLGPLLAASWRPRSRLVFGAITALAAVLALFAAETISAPPAEPEPETLAGTDQVVVALADAGRKRGSDQAPLVLDLLIDFECPRCAAVHDSVLESIAPLIKAGRLQLVVHHAVRAGDADSRLLAQWAFAAAASSADEYTLFSAGMLGSRHGAGAQELRTRLAEVLPPAPIESLIAAHPAAFARLIADDGDQVRKLGGDSATPQAFLVERASGAVRGHWSGSVPVDALVKAAER